MNREDIIKNNDKYGIKTIFYEDDQGILGYSLGNTIYLNTNSTGDLELVSKHELFHFFEETEKFIETKELLLNLLEQDGALETLRDEYSLKYNGLYTDEEIENGIIDTEIVIDLLAGNSKYSTEFIRQLGDGVLNQTAREILEKRYLVLNLRKNVATMADLSDWEKIFIENYYNQANYDGITPALNSGNKQEQVRKDIQTELNKLYELPLETFTISPNSKEVIREYESEIKALEARGEGARAELVRNNKEASCQKLAEMFSTKLYEGYKHIVDFIKGTNYEDAFKALVLRETLIKTYKKDQGNILVGKRKLNETIKGHMVLNETTLDYLNENVADYDNFANLYNQALQEFDKIILEKNNVSLDNVETYGKGHWIKFEGKASNPDGYLNNAQELTSLVQDTPWCTKTLASTQLEQGDFYVFVDNENKPHIAVKLSGSSIDEVRGILNDNAQELESDYRDVAISFLENNKSIKGGKEWYEKEEWNKRLVKYAEEIDNGNFNEENVGNLLSDIFEHQDYKSHFSKNSNLVNLKGKLELIKDKIANYYNCSKDEICIGDYIPHDEKVCPYKMILGNANLENSQVVDLGNLESITDNLVIRGSRVEVFGKLKYIGGEIYYNGGKAHFTYEGLNEYVYKWYKKLIKNIDEFNTKNNSKVEYEISLENIIDFSSDFKSFNLVNLSKKINLIKDKIAKYYNCSVYEICVGDYTPSYEKECPYKIILGAAAFGKQIISLKNVQYIGGSVNFYSTGVTDLGDLQVIGGDALFSISQITSLGNLESIGGEANFRESEVIDLGHLRDIRGTANFSMSKITDLGRLKNIGGNAYFSNSKIISLANIESIGGNADFRDTQITDFGNLQYVGGKVTFNNPEQERLYYEHMAKMQGNKPEGMHL